MLFVCNYTSQLLSASVRGGAVSKPFPSCPEGVIQSFRFTLPTVLYCLRQWLCILIQVVKQVLVTTRMKVKRLASCCISLKHSVTTGQVWTGREECC